MRRSSRASFSPAPWKPANWGVRGENLHDPTTVEWLALDRQPLGEEDERLLESLLDTQVELKYQRDDIIVARRVHRGRQGDP